MQAFPSGQGQQAGAGFPGQPQAFSSANTQGFLQVPTSAGPPIQQHHTVTLVDVHGNVLGTAVQPGASSAQSTTFVNNAGMFRPTPQQMRLQKKKQPQQNVLQYPQQQQQQHLQQLQQQLQQQQGGNRLPARQGTVTQVPAFVQARQVAPAQQQVQLQVMDVGGTTRFFNPMLGGSQVQLGGASMTVQGGGLAPGNLVSISRGPAGVPGARAGPQAGTTTLVRGPPGPTLRGTQQLCAVPGAPPGVYTTIVPQQQAGAGPITVVGPRAGGGNQHVRIPKMATVATYNPVTGVRSTAVMQGGQATVQQQQLPANMPAHLVQQVKQVNILAAAQQQQQRQQVALTIPGAAQQQQQAAAAAAQRVAGQVVNGRGGGVMTLPNTMPVPQGGQYVNISLADGTTTTAMVGQATLAQLLSGSTTSAAMIQVSSAMSMAGDRVGPGNAQAANDGQQVYGTPPHASLQLAMPSLPSGQGDEGAFLQAALQMQQQQQQHAGGDPHGYAGLGSGGSGTTARLDGLQQILDMDQTGGEGMLSVGGMLGGGAAAGSKGDLKAILVSIGHELARNGFSVEEAVAAGWLGTLTAGDVAVLADAYAEEERCLTAASFVAAAANGGSSSNPSGAADSGMIGGADDSMGRQSIPTSMAMSIPMSMPMSMPTSMAMSMPMSMPMPHQQQGQQMPHQGQQQQQQQQHELSEDKLLGLQQGFEAFSIAFMNRSKEADDADVLDKVLGNSAWHSMADELDLAAFEPAPGAMSSGPHHSGHMQQQQQGQQQQPVKPATTRRAMDSASEMENAGGGRFGVGGIGGGAMMNKMGGGDQQAALQASSASAAAAAAAAANNKHQDYVSRFAHLDLGCGFYQGSKIRIRFDTIRYDTIRQYDDSSVLIRCKIRR